MVFWTWKGVEHSVLRPEWANGEMAEDSVEDCGVQDIMPQQKSNRIITEPCNNGPLPIKKRCTEIAVGHFEGSLGIVVYE